MAKATEFDERCLELLEFELVDFISNWPFKVTRDEAEFEASSRDVKQEIEARLHRLKSEITKIRANVDRRLNARAGSKVDLTKGAPPPEPTYDEQQRKLASECEAPENSDNDKIRYKQYYQDFAFGALDWQVVHFEKFQCGEDPAPQRAPTSSDEADGDLEAPYGHTASGEPFVGLPDASLEQRRRAARGLAAARRRLT